MSDADASGTGAAEVPASVEQPAEIVADEGVEDDVAVAEEADVPDPGTPESGSDVADSDPGDTDVEVAEPAEGSGGEVAVSDPGEAGVEVAEPAEGSGGEVAVSDPGEAGVEVAEPAEGSGGEVAVSDPGEAGVEVAEPAEGSGGEVAVSDPGEAGVEVAEPAEGSGGEVAVSDPGEAGVEVAEPAEGSGGEVAVSDPGEAGVEVAEPAEGSGGEVAVSDPGEAGVEVAEPVAGEADVAVSRPEPAEQATPESEAASEEHWPLAIGPRNGDTVLAASYDRACVTRDDHGVSCWGRGSRQDRLDVAAFSDIVAVSIGDAVGGEFHACALHSDGRVSCWGPGFLGQLGQGDTENRASPAAVPGLDDVVGIAAGSAHTCALHLDGEVSCWGDGSEGQMGDGTTESSSSPQRVPGLADVAAISSGSHTSCAIHSDGSVSCWGWGFAPSPQKIDGVEQIVTISIGTYYLCAVSTGGQVYCWPFIVTVEPIPVPRIDDAVAVSVGDRNACVLHSDGGVSCWGENNSLGQLGDGTTRPRSTPKRLFGIDDAVAVTASMQSLDGEAHACVRHATGAVSCWGSNGFGQLGDGTRESRLVPTGVTQPGLPAAPVVATPPPAVGDGTDRDTAGSIGEGSSAAPRHDPFAPVSGPRSGDTLVAASYERTCAVDRNGGVSCWGRHRLRDRLSTALFDDAVAVTIGDTSDGELHACVLSGSGRVSCWGPGYEGQLGAGDDVNYQFPVEVPGITDAVAAAAGAVHTCVAHSDGGVSCWGRGAEGQLGNGTTDSSSSPQRIPDLAGVTALSAGSHTTCGVHSDATVSCWGWGVGAAPKKVAGLRDIVSLGVGWTYNCAVDSDGDVYCWPIVAAAMPSRVPGISDAVAVSVGDRSVCVVHSDGGVSCWGENNSAGQLGDGTTRARSTPTRLGGIADALDVTVSVQSLGGEAHACAVHQDGSVSCWGSNGFGQVRDGSKEPRPTPTRAVRPTPIWDYSGQADATLLMRAWLDVVVAELAIDYPWLREAWEHVRNSSSIDESMFFPGEAPVHCQVSNGSYWCEVVRMRFSSLDNLLSSGAAVHELAHVYDLTTGLTPNRAWGAVQLYFSATHRDCDLVPGVQGVGRELLADSMLSLVLPEAWLGYFVILDCPAVGDRPSPEAQAVVRAGLAGEVPDWYTENITSGAELWAAIRADPELHALANLVDEFGGLCTMDWITYPVNRALIPPEGANPFRDGGC